MRPWGSVSLDTSGANLFWVTDSFENLMKTTDPLSAETTKVQHIIWEHCRCSCPNHSGPQNSKFTAFAYNPTSHKTTHTSKPLGFLKVTVTLRETEGGSDGFATCTVRKSCRSPRRPLLPPGSCHWTTDRPRDSGVQASPRDCIWQCYMSQVEWHTF